MPAIVGNKKSKNKGWYNHYQRKWLPQHAPAHVFNEP